MYRGETGKLVLSATIFAIVFVTVKPLEVAALFTGFITMVIIHTLLVIKILKSRSR